MASHIPSPPASGIHIGPAYVHVYGLMYLVGITLAIWITRKRWRAVGGDPALVGDVALWAVPAGIIGGRIYFDLTTPADIPHVWYGVFAVWSGGLGIWGGVAAGMWAGAPGGRRRRAVRRRGGPGAAGGPGNGTARQLLQPGTVRPPHLAAVGAGDLTLAPPGRIRPVRDLPADVPVRADLRPGAGRRVGVAGPSLPDRPPGLFAFYVAGYSAFRIFEETLRIASSEHFLGLRLNFYVAGTLTVAGIAWFVHSQRKGKHAAQRTALLATGAAHPDQAASAQHPPAIAAHPHASTHG
jgi:hypothetical protein